MRVVVQILLIGFTSFYSASGVSMVKEIDKPAFLACLIDLRNESKLDRLTPRENLATVKKVFFHLLMAELNENGKKVGIAILPEDLDDRVGTVWTTNDIREESKLLVQWSPSSIRTRAVTMPHRGSSPAKIVNIAEDRITLQGQVGGESFELNAETSKVVNRGQPFSNLGLDVGTWVWVRWNPENKVVDSIVP